MLDRVRSRNAASVRPAPLLTRPPRRSYRRTTVARAYIFRGTFVVDVLSALPLSALGSAFGGGTGADGALAFKLLRLPRLLRLSRLLRKVRRRCSAGGIQLVA